MYFVESSLVHCPYHAMVNPQLEPSKVILAAKPFWTLTINFSLDESLKICADGGQTGKKSIYYFTNMKPNQPVTLENLVKFGGFPSK